MNGIKLERSSLKLELEFHLWIFCAMHFDCRKEKCGINQTKLLHLGDVQLYMAAYLVMVLEDNRI